MEHVTTDGEVLQVGAMAQSAEIDQIAAVLVKAQAAMPLVEEGQRNTYDKYNYSNLADYQRATRKVLAEHGLAVTGSCTAVEQLPDRQSSKGTAMHVVRVTAVTRLLHTSGQWIECVTYGEGEDRGDKAIYKAITGARKYGIATLLGLATTDDPERTEQESASKGNGQGASRGSNGGNGGSKGGDGDRATDKQMKALWAMSKSEHLTSEQQAWLAKKAKEKLTVKQASSAIKMAKEKIEAAEKKAGGDSPRGEVQDDDIPM